MKSCIFDNQDFQAKKFVSYTQFFLQSFMHVTVILEPTVANVGNRPEGAVRGRVQG